MIRLFSEPGFTPLVHTLFTGLSYNRVLSRSGNEILDLILGGSTFDWYFDWYEDRQQEWKTNKLAA